MRRFNCDKLIYGSAKAPKSKKKKKKKELGGQIFNSETYVWKRRKALLPPNEVM